MYMLNVILNVKGTHKSSFSKWGTVPVLSNDHVLYYVCWPVGPPVEHIREVGVALRQIGDDLDGDRQLQT